MIQKDTQREKQINREVQNKQSKTVKRERDIYIYKMGKGNREKDRKKKSVPERGNNAEATGKRELGRKSEPLTVSVIPKAGCA